MAIFDKKKPVPTAEIKEMVKDETSSSQESPMVVFNDTESIPQVEENKISQECKDGATIVGVVKEPIGFVEEYKATPKERKIMCSQAIEHIEEGCVKCTQHVCQHAIGLMPKTFGDILGSLAIDLNAFQTFHENSMSISSKQHVELMELVTDYQNRFKIAQEVAVYQLNKDNVKKSLIGAGIAVGGALVGWIVSLFM